MPNHVRNKLTVIGTDDLVSAFVRAAVGKDPRSGDPPLTAMGNPNPNYVSLEEWKAKPAEPLCFHAIVPLSPAFERLPYGDRGPEIQRAAWGVKWGAYDFAEGTPLIEPGRATYEFTTAWGSPELFVAKASLQFRKMFFVVSYGGEGPIRGWYTYIDGSQLSEHHDAYDPADYPPDELMDTDDAAWTEQRDAAQEKYLREHGQLIETCQPQGA